MPVPSVIINILNNQTVGQSLALECDVTTVRGITSRVDIVWSSDSSGESGLDIISGAYTTSIAKDSVLFTDTYIIPQLSTADENEEYQCWVFIDALSPITANNSVILNVTGKCVYIYYYSTYMIYCK